MRSGSVIQNEIWIWICEPEAWSCVSPRIPGEAQPGGVAQQAELCPKGGTGQGTPER